MEENKLGRSPKPSREVPTTAAAAVAVEGMMAGKTESVMYLLVAAKVMVSVMWMTWKKVNKRVIKRRNTVFLKQLTAFLSVNSLVTALTVRSQVARLVQAYSMLIFANVLGKKRYLTCTLYTQIYFTVLGLSPIRVSYKGDARLHVTASASSTILSVTYFWARVLKLYSFIAY